MNELFSHNDYIFENIILQVSVFYFHTVSDSFEFFSVFIII